MNKNENKNEKIMKPTSVAVVELQNDLIELINNSNLPGFIIEPILKDLWAEAKATAKLQYENDKKMYEDSIRR